MNPLRYAIFMGGGLLLCVLYIAISLCAPFMTDIWAIIAFLIVSFGALMRLDRFAHLSLYGRPLVFLIEKYKPCDVCPFTLGKATQERILLASVSGGAGGVIGIYTLPIRVLISSEAALSVKSIEVNDIPGVKVTRITHDTFTINIKNDAYFNALKSANEHALVKDA